MGKVIAVAGQIASGKTTLAEFMETHGFERIVTYTTRPKRNGEKDGVSYHFQSTEEFLEKAEAEFFAEDMGFTAKFGYVRYGTSKESLETPGGVKFVGHHLDTKRTPDFRVESLPAYGLVGFSFLRLLRFCVIFLQTYVIFFQIRQFSYNTLYHIRKERSTYDQDFVVHAARRTPLDAGQTRPHDGNPRRYYQRVLPRTGGAD